MFIIVSLMFVGLLTFFMVKHEATQKGTKYPVWIIFFVLLLCVAMIADMFTAAQLLILFFAVIGCGGFALAVVCLDILSKIIKNPIRKKTLCHWCIRLSYLTLIFFVFLLMSLWVDTDEHQARKSNVIHSAVKHTGSTGEVIHG